ncbi:MAG: hypothetical protein PHV28_19410, partial [Kiritimatiellae bacterium]|nr:hypothetical protein [Kiritimatiellia bacterium]
MMKVTYNYDGDECVADVDASGNPLRAYTWGQGIDIKRAQSPRRSSRATAILRPARRAGARSRIRRRSGNCHLLAVTVFSAATNTYYAVKDHLGSVHALVDASGNAALTVTYDAWGNVQSAVSNGQLAARNRYLFQGREYSFATGLYNFRARWYDPRLGRWLSNDPIGISGGLNLYEFCGNDPVNWRDPDGLRVEIHSRWVKGLEGIASHTYITVTDSKGQVNTWGSYKDNGCNTAKHDDPSDVGTLRTSTVTVPPPPGMTQDEWDVVVNLEGLIRVHNQKQKYWPLGGGREGKRGNCHNTTRAILEGAG